MQLKSDMAIAQVICRLQQLQGMRPLHPQQRFRRCRHLHNGQTGLIPQQITRLQRSHTGQLKQHRTTAGGGPTTAQHRALFGCQRQVQGCRGTAVLQALLQHDHRIRHQRLLSRSTTKACRQNSCTLVFIATELKPAAAEREAMQRLDPWHGRCDLQFHATNGSTRHQGGCTAPFKLLRSERGDDGRCELPVLHTAGGLVGGDQLSLDIKLEASSRGLITSVAAQKVYGSIGRSRLQPEGCFAHQQVRCSLASGSDLEWLPQELVLYADALFEQELTVTLPEDASFLSAEIVRLGRTAAGETLQQGRWRSHLTIQRVAASSSTWELADRVELGGASLDSPHGLGGAPVFGTLVWAAPMAMGAKTTEKLLEGARADREGLTGTMRCGALDQGLIARYSGTSSRDARFWFSRIWERTRRLRGLTTPRIPRVWPLQEQPLRRQTSTVNAFEAAAETH